MVALCPLNVYTQEMPPHTTRKALVPPSQPVSVRELRANLPAYLRRASQGDSVVVTVRGKEVARIIASSPPPGRQRQFGLLEGQVWIAPDFDEPLDDLMDSMETPIDPAAR